MPSILDTFVALDIRTAGPDPASADLRSLAAVAVGSGKVGDRFEGSAPSQRGAAGVLAELAAFVGDRPVIVYDPPFVRDFVGGSLFPGGVHGLRDLARAALPRLLDHKLPTLAGFFGIEGGDGAEAVARVYLAVLDSLRERDFALLQRMLGLISGTDSGLIPIFVALANEGVRRAFKKKRGAGREQGYLRNLFNVDGSAEAERPRSDGEGRRPVDVRGVKKAFEAGGLFSGHVPGYEVRPQQIEMAVAVTEAFNGGNVLVVEAGTGVGKSMAYLAPAIRFAVANGARIVVSTNTKNLQEQLFYKDLPDLAGILDAPFRYVLLKGRSNYLCRNRWEAALAHPQVALTEEERVAALPLALWAAETQTGDIAENAGFDAGEAPGLWAKVCSDPAACRSQRCRTNGLCFANQIRRAAASAHVVVVNHALLFSDMAAENAILSDYRDVILDEAHNVEKVAAQYLGREATVWRVRNLTSRLCSRELVSTGALPSLSHWLRASRLKDAVLQPFEAGIDAATKASDALWEAATGFFQALADAARERARGERSGEYAVKLRYRQADRAFEPVADELSGLLGRAERLTEEARKLVEWLRDLPENAFPNQDELFNDLEGRVSECAELVEDLRALTDPDDGHHVFWMEVPAREGSMDVRLRSAPLDVSGHLTEHLYAKVETAVFTSATIAIRGKLQYFLTRHGLDRLPEGRVRAVCVGSPFDYDRQALVCAPAFIPSPKSPDFGDAVEDLLRDLVLGVERGTLTLFTSYGMLNRAYGRLKGPFEARGILLLGQGIDGARSAITAQFKLDRKSVLFGTDSFWEGIDVPGEALEVLVIVRLPFAVPSDPLVAAQMEEVEKQGKDSFLHYSVPEAILKFRQGFGRLIRNRADRGVVVVLDSRVLTTRYGRAFLEALPAPHRVFKRKEEMIEEIGRWFKRGT